MTWTRALAAVAAVSLAFGAAVAHQGGTTGHATVSVAGQSVRYALSLPAEGLGDATRDLRELAAAVARHVAIEADGAACSGVPAETRPPSAGRASIEVVVLYACAAPIRNLSIRDGIDALLGVDHHTIADIQWPGGARQVIFEKGQRQASIAITGEAVARARSGGPVRFLSWPRCRAHHRRHRPSAVPAGLAGARHEPLADGEDRHRLHRRPQHHLEPGGAGHGRRAVVDRRAADRRLDRLGRRREPRGAGGRRAGAG